MIRLAFRVLIRLSAVAVVAAGLGACSDLPDWLGGDSTPADEPSTATDVPVTSTDQPAGPQGKTVAEASDQYPTLADTPSKAPPTSTSDEQKQVSNALVADRSQAQYSADALRAGDVTAAAPPPPASAESSTVVPPPASDNSSSAAAPPAAAPAAVPPSPASAPPAPATTVASNAAPAPAPAAATPPPPPPPVRPAVTDDAALGFQPSHAPPLDPSIPQTMGAPHQQRLASVSKSVAPVSIPGGAPAAVVAFPENSIGLDANGVAQVQAAVAAFKAKGGSGYVRVVGHSASGAPNLPADKQLMQSFERSQACANSVARQLIRDGVPANRVLVDATSTLASGEQRRAEIFF